MGFPDGSVSKESACSVGDLGLIPGLGRSRGEGNGNPLQYSFLENPQGQRSLAGCSPWGCKESDMTEQLSTAQHTRAFFAGVTVHPIPCGIYRCGFQMSSFTVYFLYSSGFGEKKRQPSKREIKAFIWVMLNCMSTCFRLSSAPTEVTNG